MGDKRKIAAGVDPDPLVSTISPRRMVMNPIDYAWPLLVRPKPRLSRWQVAPCREPLLRLAAALVLICLLIAALSVAA